MKFFFLDATFSYFYLPDIFLTSAVKNLGSN